MGFQTKWSGGSEETRLGMDGWKSSGKDNRYESKRGSIERGEGNSLIVRLRGPREIQSPKVSIP